MKQIHQGHIYLANLKPTRGNEQSGTRPVLVVQNDKLNKSLNTVIAVPLTSNLTYRGFLTTAFVPKKSSKLPMDSLALLFQIRSIDKSRLIKEMGAMPNQNFSRLREKLKYLFF